MKFAVALLTMATFAGFSNAGQLRASTLVISEEVKQTTGINGTIVGGLFIEGNITHEFLRPERVQASNCLISAYNTALSTTGYQLTSFAINQGYYHVAANVTVFDKTLGKTITKNRHTWVGLTGNLDYFCKLCGNNADLALGTNPYIPPLNSALSVYLSDCLTAANFSGITGSDVAFFPPVNSSNLYQAASAVTDFEPDALKAAATMIASKDKDVDGMLMGSSVQLESTININNISMEFSDANDAIVGACYTNNYNLQYGGGDWTATDFAVNRETSVYPNTTYAFIFMDVYVTYNCSACVQTVPPDSVANHAAFESLLGSCIKSSGSSAFYGLTNTTVKHTFGNSVSTTRAFNRISTAASSVYV